MKTSLDHLPQKKQRALHLITELIKEIFNPSMIILYGSYARGDWVDIDREYQSDYDILVVCSQKKKKNYALRTELEKRVEMDDEIDVRVSYNYEQFSIVNAEIRKYNYLFIDIRREGILLYSTGGHQLEDVIDLEPKERYEKAIRDFKYWINQSNKFIRAYNDDIKDVDRENLAAFHLHQRTEHLYMALLLVYTGYKPKGHDLLNLEDMVIPFYKEIRSFFPRKTKEEEHLYNLLRKAYVDARYDMNYTITLDELDTLKGWIEQFRELAIKLCKTKLEELKEKAENEE